MTGDAAARGARGAGHRAHCARRAARPRRHRLPVRRRQPPGALRRRRPLRPRLEPDPPRAARGPRRPLRPDRATSSAPSPLYGRDNRIDGIVLDVLLRKHRAIRKTTGVSVPVPVDSRQRHRGAARGPDPARQRTDQLSSTFGPRPPSDAATSCTASGRPPPSESRCPEAEYAAGASTPTRSRREVDDGARRAGQPGEVETLHPRSAARARRLDHPSRRRLRSRSPPTLPVGLRDALPPGHRDPLPFHREPARSAAATPCSPAPTRTSRRSPAHVLDTALDPMLPAAGATSPARGVVRTRRRHAAHHAACSSASDSTSMLPGGDRRSRRSPRMPGPRLRGRADDQPDWLPTDAGRATARAAADRQRRPTTRPRPCSDRVARRAPRPCQSTSTPWPTDRAASCSTPTAGSGQAPALPAAA